MSGGWFRNLFSRPEAEERTRPAPVSLLEGLGTLATELWRLRARLASAEQTPDRMIESSVARMEETLIALGVRLEDPSGQTWDERDPMQVLLFEPSKDVSRPTVAEVVKPTVYVGDRLLLPGQVIVAVPPEVLDGNGGA